MRFAVGTLTAVPVTPPRVVDRRVALTGLLLAPLAVVPLGLLVAMVLAGGRELGLSSLAVGVAATAALALGSRAFHLDGLADTADALTSSYDRERALAVMKRGDTGPAGAAALALTLGVQAASFAALTHGRWGPLLAGALVCASRVAPALLCSRGLPAARPGGLTASYAGTLHPGVPLVGWAVLAGLLAAVSALAGLPWWRGVVCAVVGLLLVAALARRAMRRLGGVTGDIHGAGIELALAGMLLAAT
ncbi:adenosylcobinamide-GDP ribazoletransferase [Nocardioides ochotonae]|uniref:adenosylcobinamide-GDP ribazoletransferase n=1 Tax=Nocardioides ochotonae TaxID=2685869 RepID=UPI001CD4004A|nr:adenosylcobinamide-GDP ribazoletransferase [Nocardioides ochotonae]